MSKPTVEQLKMLENVPEEMKAARRWLLHTGKVPKQVSGDNASSTDPATWTDYQSALAAYEAGEFDGLGFALGDGWLGVDIDECADATGGLSPVAEAILNEFDSYTEWSPSGRGVHVIGRGESAASGKGEVDGQKVEVYPTARYFTVTGDRLADRPAMIGDVTEPFRALAQRVGARSRGAETQGAGALTPPWPDKTPLSEAEMAKRKTEVENLRESIDTSGGSNACIGAMRDIVRMGLGEEDSRELARHYNATRCTPPWDEVATTGDSSLWKKLRDARKKVYADGEHPDQLTEILNTPPAGDVAKPVADKPRKRFSLELRTLSQLLAEEFNQRFLVNGAVVEGESLVIGGPPKCHKTGVLLDLGVSIAHGVPFLNRFEVTEAKPVIVISTESGGPSIQRKVRAILEAKRIDPSDRLHFGFKRPNLRLAEHLQAIREDVERTGAKFVAIDPAYLSVMCGEQAGNVFAMGQILGPLDEIGTEFGCVMCLAHHTKKFVKNREYSEPTMADLSQSGFAEWMRQWILMNKKTEITKGVSEVHLEMGGSAGHSGSYFARVDEGEAPTEDIDTVRKWNVTVFNKDGDDDMEVDDDATLKKHVQQVAQALEGLTKPASQTLVAERAKLSNANAKRALEKLRNDGLVKIDWEGKWSLSDAGALWSLVG